MSLRKTLPLNSAILLRSARGRTGHCYTGSPYALEHRAGLYQPTIYHLLLHTLAWYPMAANRHDVKLRFPLWSYLNQPLFGSETCLILSPKKFWYAHNIRLLERCWANTLESPGQQR